jgi:hypothetical protein
VMPGDRVVSSVEEQLLGGWKLVSATTIGPGGRSDIYGPQPMGTILYTPNHRMSATLGRRDLPRIRAGEDLSPEDARAFFMSFVAYIGAWELDEANGAVIHRVDYCSHDGLSGTDQVRYLTFEGDRLILRTPPTGVGGDEYGEIVWERA